MSNTIAILLAALSPASATDVAFNGTIVALDEAGCGGAQYAVEGTNVVLDAGGLLEPFVGETWLVRGTPIFVDGCEAGVILALDSLAPPTATLDLCGSSGVGCPLRFRVGATEPGVDLLVAGVGDPFFGPLGELGVLFVPSPLVSVGFTDGDGVLDVNVPNSFELIGAEVGFQALHVSSTGAALSNPKRTTVAPHGPFCLDLSLCD